MTGPETQNQTEYIEGKNNGTNAEKEADYIVIEWRDPITADERLLKKSSSSYINEKTFAMDIFSVGVIIAELFL